MPVRRRKGSPYWQIRFEIAGREIRRSTSTTDRAAAQELEKKLYDDLWRQIKLGERRYTWDDAVKQCELEDSQQKSWDRKYRSIKILNEYLAGEDLREITYESILNLRSLLQLRDCKGYKWKTKRQWKPRTVNRILAVLAGILNRCASKDWKMLDEVPEVPLLEVEDSERKWVTREQALALLALFPPHTRDMMIVALATGLRRSNVTGLEWSRIDLQRARCYVPGYLTKSGEPIPVPLNAEAVEAIKRWQGKHERYVFVFRGRAPIKQVTTKMWRTKCKAAGLEGVTFHTMRHSWASWHTQAGTPPRQLQDLGGWASLQMPMLYSHLDPGHLSQYADRTLLRTETGTLTEEKKQDSVSACFGGEGGTRTLDPGIMRRVLKRKA